jgi:NAD-dependent SIR2 family protein deacetylase
VQPVLGLLRDGFVALTGAGVSTDSGIPDYRGPGSVARQPMTYQDFVSGPDAQQRYWARSHLGWSRMRRALPNGGHHALARLEARGAVRLLITQNVDGLHEAAGSRNVCALHGRISDVICLSCREVSSRSSLHRRLEELNAGWAVEHASVEVRPDGDVALEETAGFVVPRCACGGALKPDVVFFGENVPKERVFRCYDAVAAAPALLVLGSSLAVMSGLRFVKAAAKQGTPVVIVNRGETRGDELATYKLEMGTTEFLCLLEATYEDMARDVAVDLGGLPATADEHPLRTVRHADLAVGEGAGAT